MVCWVICTRRAKRLIRPRTCPIRPCEFPRGGGRDVAKRLRCKGLRRDPQGL